MNEMSSKPEKSRKRMTVFRKSDAVPMANDHMPMVGFDDSVMAGFAKLMEVGMGSTIEGEKVTILFSEPGDTGLSLTHAWFKSGYVLPRHSHNADCLYYILGGSLRMGSVTLGKGEGIFIPSDDAYSYEVGPEGVEVLEFRNATQFNIHFKNNDEAHWGKMADAFRTGAEKWQGESAPFSAE